MAVGDGNGPQPGTSTHGKVFLGPRHWYRVSVFAGGRVPIVVVLSSKMIHLMCWAEPSSLRERSEGRAGVGKEDEVRRHVQGHRPSVTPSPQPAILEFTSAPFSTINFTTSSCPFEAATCSTVLPHESLVSISNACSSRKRSDPVCPFSAARCRIVRPRPS